ncbi:GNAT family N-acetyltransferase [Emcibacter sp. SYSU 3D8]|uniref:GNAT family N-acetyltransferase n=1 Tax=Emcibacter sp. SYSU 3D8 TaxID=3133969 RepID=UPI0031FF4393
MKQQKLETDRLILRRWRREDHAPFAAFCADPDVMEFIGSGATLTPEQASGLITCFEKAWDENGYGLFAAERRETNEFIGFAGLARPGFMPELLPSVEIGWRLGKAHWGKGYATEAAAEALAFGIRCAAVEDIVSICQVGNVASTRIMQKIGLEFDQRSIDPTCNRDVVVYRLPR